MTRSCTSCGDLARVLPRLYAPACLQHGALRADEYRYIRVRAVDPSVKERRIVWGEDGEYDDDRGLWSDAAGDRLGAGNRSIVWGGTVDAGADSAVNEAN